MSEPLTAAAPDKTTTDALIITSQTYANTAEHYAESTADYANYPGLYEEVLRFESALPPGGGALDLGCGGGRDSRVLAGLGRPVIAGDICGEMLTCARRRSTAQTRGIRYVRMNMLALPIRDGSLAGIWASASLLHLPSGALPRALSEILRTLRPGGGAAAISMRAGDDEGWREGGTIRGRRWFNLVEPGDFTATMLAMGFRDVTISHSGREGWFVAVGRR
jgi:SAM-dependent methyltransferase